MQDCGIIGMRVNVSVLEDLYVRVHSISDVGDGDDHTSKAEEPVIRILGMCQIRIPNLIDVHPELAHLTAWSSTYPAFSFMPDILVPLCCCRPCVPAEPTVGNRGTLYSIQSRMCKVSRASGFPGFTVLRKPVRRCCGGCPRPSRVARGFRRCLVAAVRPTPDSASRAPAATRPRPSPRSWSPAST